MTESQAVVGTEPVARRMTRAFAALSGGRVLTLALQLVAFGVVAAELGPAGLGAYTFAIAIYGLFAYVTNFGIRTIAMRDIAQEPERERELVVNLFYLRVVLGVAAYVVLAGSLWLGGYSPVERQAGLVAGVLVIALALESFQVILEVRLRMGWVSVAAVAQGVVLAGGTLAVALRGPGVVAFLWVFVLSNLVNFAIVAGVALRQAAGLVWRPKVGLWLHLARAAAVLGLSQLCIALYYRLDLLILAAIKPDDDVGQYGAAYRVLETLIVVPSLAMTVLTPVIAASVVAGRAVLQRRYERVVHLIVLLTFPLAVAGVLTAPRVLPAVPGFSEFGGAGVALAVLAPAAPCIFLGAALSAVLVSGHEQRRLLRVSVVVLALNVALNVALIPPFSYRGAAVATTLTELAVVYGLARAVHRHLGVPWPWSRVGRALRASAAMAVAVVAASVLGLPVVVPPVIGIVVYLVVLLPTGALRWDDLGGLMGSDAAPVVVPGEAVRADGPGGVQGVPLTSPWATWRALLGAGHCVLVERDRPLPTWLPVAARLAGADPVVLRVEEQVDAPDRRRNLLWPWFVGRLELGPHVDETVTRSRWPRLVPLLAAREPALPAGARG